MQGTTVHPSARPPVRRVLVISHVYIDPANRGKLRALAARGLDVTVGVPQRWKEAALGRVVVTGWERQGGLEIFPIPARARYGRRALVALLRDKRPELIQIEEEPASKAALQVAQAARRLAIPAVLFTRDNVGTHLGPLARWRRRRTLRRLRGVIAGSEAAGALVRRDAPSLPLAVIPQLGVRVPPAPEHFRHEGLGIGYIGRLVPEKGLDTLLQALAETRTSRWQLTVVGDGPDRERLESMATELRLAARIRWTGALPRDQVPRIWPELDVLVLPSRSLGSWNEPVGQVLVEAMAHEVAVLGTAAGAIPEVIGDAGIVVPAGDRAALAAALQELANDGVRRPLAQAGRARAMKYFSDDAIAERTINFWREIEVIRKG